MAIFKKGLTITTVLKDMAQKKFSYTASKKMNLCNYEKNMFVCWYLLMLKIYLFYDQKSYSKQ